MELPRTISAGYKAKNGYTFTNEDARAYNKLARTGGDLLGLYEKIVNPVSIEWGDDDE